GRLRVFAMEVVKANDGVVEDRDFEPEAGTDAGEAARHGTLRCVRRGVAGARARGRARQGEARQRCAEPHPLHPRMSAAMQTIATAPTNQSRGLRTAEKALWPVLSDRAASAQEVSAATRKAWPTKSTAMTRGP